MHHPRNGIQRLLTTLPALALLTFASACDTEDASDLGDAFRTLDINIQLAQADGGDDDGTILWEIVDGQVWVGEAAAGTLGVYIQDNGIYMPDGTLACTINTPNLQSNLREVIDQNGTDVLFTTWGNLVFLGSIDASIPSYNKLMKEYGDRLLFEFSNNEVYFREVQDGIRLLSADGDIEGASDGRRLLISSLITGWCGTPGVPGYIF